MFKFKPPSKRIIIKARTTNTPEIGVKIPGSIILNTGPSRIPNMMRMSISGIPVFLKRYCPMKPRIIIMPANPKAKITMIIFYFLLNIFVE